MAGIPKNDFMINFHEKCVTKLEFEFATPDPEVIKLFFHAQQLSVKFYLVIKIKIQTIKTFFMLNSAELSMKKVL